MRRMHLVVEHLDVDRLQGGGGHGVLAGVRIAGVARMGAGGDLEADTVPAGEAMADRPQVEADAAAPVIQMLERLGAYARKGDRDVPGGALLVDVAHAREQVELGRVGAHEEIDAHWSDRLERGGKHRRRVRDDVGPGFQRAVVEDRLA